MGLYLIDFTESAINDLKQHKKSGDKATMKKIDVLVDELKLHPKSGTGKPEALKHGLFGYWSRRINQKDRLVYKIEDEKLLVTVISVMGHYSDKLSLSFKK
jgi:toxin YoeB